VEPLLYIRTVVKSYKLTAVDLSDRTDRATSFASQVLESFVFKKVEFIGPTETDMTMLFFRSRRSDTIRCRASAAPQQQLKDQFAINNTRKSFFFTAALYNVKISASSHHSGTKQSDEF
jgi:hypothetical protein